MHQQFPVQTGRELRHKRWQVDFEAACAFTRAPVVSVERLAGEVADMAAAFPRWFLTLACDAALVTCKQCKGHLVFDRGARCVVCDTPYERKARSPVPSLAWFGLLPPIGIDGLAHIASALRKKPPPRHVAGERAELGQFLLVPLIASYPDGYPERPLRVFYLPEFQRVPGMPALGPSHSYHMLSGGQMCLYASGEWRPDVTCKEVLQQRAYAHVIKLLNYANGKHAAFAKVTR